MAIYNPDSNQHSDGSDSIATPSMSNKRMILNKLKKLSNKEYEDGSIICDDLHADIEEIWHLIKKLL